MQITKRMRKKSRNSASVSSKAVVQRDALGTQIVAALSAGRSIAEIATSMNLTVPIIDKLAREKLAGQMELIDDLQYQRHLQLLKVRALEESRMQPAIDGDNIAMGQMIKLLPLENGLLGLDGKKSVQEVMVNGTVTTNTNTTHTNVTELGERATEVLNKYLGAEVGDDDDAPNTHKPRNDMAELLGKIDSSNKVNVQKDSDDEIVDAEIVEDDDGEQ